LMVGLGDGSDTRRSVEGAREWLRAPEGKAWRDRVEAKGRELREKILQGEEVLEVARMLRTEMKSMGRACGVDVEPDEVTALIEALLWSTPGDLTRAVYSVAPGAGGFDAVAVIVDKEEGAKEWLQSRLYKINNDKEFLHMALTGNPFLEFFNLDPCILVEKISNLNFHIL